MDVILHLINRDHILWVLNRCRSFLHDEEGREDAAKVVDSIYTYVQNIHELALTYTEVQAELEFVKREPVEEEPDMKISDAIFNLQMIEYLYREYSRDCLTDTLKHSIFKQYADACNLGYKALEKQSELDQQLQQLKERENTV